MLRWRLLLGTLFIAALVIWCWLDFVVTRPGAFLGPLALGLTWCGVVELLDMFNQKGRYPIPWVMYGGSLFAVLVAGLPVLWPGADSVVAIGRLGWLAVGLIAGLLLAFIGELLRYGGHYHATLNMGLSIFGIAYIGGLMGFIVQLRILSASPWGTDGRWGMLALVSLIATVKMSDTGQYAFGRLIGRHKMAPNVSPGKTWEGAVGGVLVAVGTAWVVFTWGAEAIVGPSASQPSPVAIAAFGIAVAAAGILGDLAESMLKRDADVKDSSTWLPGFGGVLDLLDSLLGAAPVAYLFWAFRIVGP
jgi:phosphatidate cytidylyltransferase